MTKLILVFLGASVLVLTSCAKGVGDSSNASIDQNSPEGGELPPFPSLPPDDSQSGTSVNVIPPFPEDAKKFNAPWTRTDTAIVIDAYEGNSINWNLMATDPRVAAVIHRASSGLVADTAYQSRQVTAKQRGYLWGAYHLGKSGDPIAQAKLFLKIIGTADDTLMFLDLEDTSNSGMMNIPNAILFMNYVFQQTGRIPVVYANHSVTLALNVALHGNALFKKARLWYARFKSSVNDFPAGVWPTYFLWQFSSEINCTSTGHCLYNVPGTSFDMDIDVYYGTREALASEWK